MSIFKDQSDDHRDTISPEYLFLFVLLKSSSAHGFGAKVLLLILVIRILAGLNQFHQDIALMINTRSSWYWWINWLVITPGLINGLQLAYTDVVRHTETVVSKQ